jgi:uncharacterized membrane protein YjfL (UPF0719 family)
MNLNVTVILLALSEFVLTAALSVLVVYVVYRLLIVTNTDYDAEDEIKADNKGVAMLLAGLVVAGGLMVREGIYPVMNIVRLYFTTPQPEFAAWQMVLLALGHVLLVFVIATFTLSLSLRLWGKLTPRVQNGAELKRGNFSVGIVLTGVVLVVALFMGEGISRLTKSLIPQPSLGQVEFAD